MKKITAILLAAAIFAAAAFAEEGAVTSEEDDMFSSSDDSGDEGDLFSAGGGLVEDVTDSQDSGIEYKGLEYEAVRIGGSFNFTATNSWSWSQSADDGSWTTPDPEGTLFDLDIDAELFFEARPDTDSKYFGKIGINGPLFTIDDDASTPMLDESWDFGDIITIEELFADFNWNEDIFLRAGKQTINSGVGYFYSPADVLSLAEIDPEDPDAELEGPVAVKAVMPIELNTLSLYVVIDEEAVTVADTAIVPAFEFVVGGTEIGLGGYYRYNQDPRVYATVSTSIFGDEMIFAEALAGYGSGSGLLLDGNDELFAQLTAGAMYSDNLTTDDDFNIFSYSLAGQYLFNYGDEARTTNITYADDHYFTLMGSLSDIAETDTSLALTYQHNISDASGRLYANAGWELFDGFKLNGSLMWLAGDPGDEFTTIVDGFESDDSVAFSIYTSLGSGSF